MNLIRALSALFLLVQIFSLASANETPMKNRTKQPISIAIHGGAGTILKENMTEELERSYHEKLSEALEAGYKILESGGASLDAVQTAIMVMEDSPLFNAGKGSVFTHHKTNEMDASIMDGSSLAAGAVTGVSHVKNPIRLAYKVMTQSSHVLLSGARAEEFAKAQDEALVDAQYFHTERRWRQLMKILKDDPDASALSESKEDKVSAIEKWPDDKKFGTVGAVALDQNGNLAAGTSTGGMTNKKYGRIGDSPIIGAGTYADNAVCAVSSTGHGEFFIRAVVAHDICARAKYKGISVQQAADEVVLGRLVELGGEGGIVAMTPKGEPVFSFNSSGMYRGYIDTSGHRFSAIYQEKNAQNEDRGAMITQPK